MTQCTATSKQSGQRCKRHATPGRNVCVMHGSRTPRGIASPHFKHGKYTPSLVGQLLSDYQTARADPDLLNLQEEIALIDARLASILKRADKGESGALWKRAREAWKEYETAHRNGDTAAEVDALASIGQALERGHLDYTVWAEISRLMDTRRKLVESERRRMVDMRALVSTEDVMIAVKALVNAVRMYVKDPATLRDIVNEIERSLGRQPDRTDDPSRIVAHVGGNRFTGS